MEVYGSTGQVICLDRHRIEIRLNNSEPVQASKLKELDPPVDDPFAYFAAVVNNEVVPRPSDLSSLQNNLLVVEILDAAKRSAKQKRSVPLAGRDK